jgi:hypothetical protein
MGEGYEYFQYGASTSTCANRQPGESHKALDLIVDLSVSGVWIQYGRLRTSLKVRHKATKKWADTWHVDCKGSWEINAKS